MKESEKAEADKAKKENIKKMNILPSLMHSGTFIPPSITRQAINDALESQGIDPNSVDVEEEYVQQDSMASAGLNIMILVVMMGAVYHFLRQILKEQNSDDEVQKYEDGIDSLIGRGGNPNSAVASGMGSSGGLGGPGNDKSFIPLAGIKDKIVGTVDDVYKNS